MTMRIPNVLILLVMTLLLSCSSGANRYADSGVGGTGNIALNGDDESGIGGTGKAVAHSGVGGTGKAVAHSGVGGTGKAVARSGVGGTGKQLASGLGGTGKKRDGMGGTGQIANSSGVGGTGIIGEVTGFGSIYVNGIEVEILDYSEIRTDNKPDRLVKPNIGDIVEIMAHRIGDETHAKILNIRHEVVGPVESINATRRNFTIIGQTIQLNSRHRLPALGDMIAVSGLRDQRGIIHATRISGSSSTYVWLIDEISDNQFNTLRFGKTRIHTEHASYYRKGDVIRVRAAYKNGSLFAKQIYPNNAFGNHVQHMILQGYIQRGNRNNYQIGSIQFSTRSARMRSQLAQQSGRWTRIEVRRNTIGLWLVEHIIGNSNLRRGNVTPIRLRNRSQRTFNRSNNAQPNASRGTSRRSGSRTSAPKEFPTLPETDGDNGLPQNPIMPNMPNMPNFPNKPALPKSMPELPKSMPQMPSTLPAIVPNLPMPMPMPVPVPVPGMMPGISKPDTSRQPTFPSIDSSRPATIPDIGSPRVPEKPIPSSGSAGGNKGGATTEDPNKASGNRPMKPSGGMM